MARSVIPRKVRRSARWQLTWLRLGVLALLLTLSFASGVAFANNLPVVVAGDKHSCALSSLSGGTVSCWGDNSMGQLGDGTNVTRLLPTEVPGLTGVSALAAGGDHTCAIIAATGGVKCWGANFYGQLGNNTTTNSSSPVDVLDNTLSPLVGVAEITAGSEHTCARFTTGGAVCWGQNANGQLGDGGATDKSVAWSVVGFTSDVSQISAGYAHTCLIKTSTSEIWCFGENIYGALGNNSTAASSLGVLVSGISNAVEVSAGNRFTCARLSNGGLKCWGANFSGNLGDGTTTNSLVPVSVGNQPVATIIDAGGADGDSSKFTCAVLTTTGQALCWGIGTFGVLGNGTEDQNNLPGPVTGLSQVVAIATGSYHSCAWIGTCTIKCWGFGWLGRLGTGGIANATTPVEIRTCDAPTPTPTPTPTPSPTPSPTPTTTPTPQAPPAERTPDACRLVRNGCVADSSLTNAYKPVPPALTATGDKNKVTLTAGAVKLGAPNDETQRKKLIALLQKLLGKKITNLATTLRSLQVWYVFTAVRAKTMVASDREASALPTRYRLETRNRRVTARLGPGSYVASVSIKIKTPKGTVLSTSKSSSATFQVK